MRILICDIEADRRRQTSLGERFDLVLGAEQLRCAHACTGCFRCWTQTPGRCVIRDALADLGCALGAADELLVASRNTFGGYSSLVKRAIDRSIPCLHPCFRIVEGQMRHRLRYGSGSDGGDHRLTVRIWLYGPSTAGERDGFARAAAASAANFGFDPGGIWFPDGLDGVGRRSADGVMGPSGPDTGRPGDDAVAGGTGGDDARSLRTPPRRIGCVCASPRGSESASRTLIDDFVDALRVYDRLSRRAGPARDDGDPVAIRRFQLDADGAIGGIDEAVHERPGDRTAGIAACDTLVIGHPVYVDALPSALIRLLERLGGVEGPARGTRVYAISNLGFYEARQGRLACGVLERFCRARDLVWGGAVIVGAGGMIGAIRDTPRMGRLRRPVSEAIDRLILAVRCGMSIAETDDARPDLLAPASIRADAAARGHDDIIETHPKIPRFAYRREAERRWRALARQRGCDPDAAPRWRMR